MLCVLIGGAENGVCVCARDDACRVRDGQSHLAAPAMTVRSVWRRWGAGLLCIRGRGQGCVPDAASREAWTFGLAPRDPTIYRDGPSFRTA